MLQQLTRDEYKNLSTILDTYALKGRGKYSQLRPEHRKTPTFVVPCATCAFHCERCHILFPYHRVSNHKHKYNCAYSYYSLEGLMKRTKKLLDYTDEQGFAQNSLVPSKSECKVGHHPWIKKTEVRALRNFINQVCEVGRRRSIHPYKVDEWTLLCDNMPDCNTCTRLFPYKNRMGSECPPENYKVGSILRRAYKLLKNCEM